MILDLEAAILARLAAKCAAGSVLLGTYDLIDFTDDNTAPVTLQIRLSRIDPAGQTGQSVRLSLTWVCTVYVDVPLASAPQKTAADSLLFDAMAALAGWEASPGREFQILDGDETSFDGRILRLSFGFTFPAHVTGTT
jgi:hypothetical protein